MSSDYEKAVDVLTKDVKDLRADMKGILNALHGKAGDYLGCAKESAQDCITRRPFVSVLAALGAGVVLGSLLRRWGRR